MTTIKLKNGSGAPTAGDLAQGEPALDLTNKRLYTEDSLGAVIEVGTNPGVDVTFADNRKAVFGDSSDLQIYHDGSHSFISDQGTGQLRILASQFQIMNAAGTESMVFGAQDNTATLYYDNSAKLATTSTGIDVTGSISADGLTVDGNPVINGTSPQLFLQTGSSNYNWQIAAQENVSDAFEISSGSADANATDDTYTKRLVIQQSGDISFYEDTGTTAKFFWDASAEALGIGTSSPATTLTVEGSGANGIELNRNGADATQSARLFFDSSTSGYAVTNVAGALAFNSGATAGVSSGTERMRIDASGDLLVNTTTSGVWGNATQSVNDNGHSLRNDGIHGSAAYKASANVGYVQYLNRTGTDGGIAAFYKDGSPVGSIGTEGGNLVIDGSAATSKSGIEFSGAEWLPRDAGANTDGAISLGDATNRFKDLYLSGKTYLNTSSGAQLVFQTDATRGFIGTSTSHALVLETAGTERARIDSSGNLLVGTTDSSLYNNATGEGVAIHDDHIQIARSGNSTLSLNRQTSDGTILDIRKDGTTVGSIGTSGGDLYIGTGDTVLAFLDGGDFIAPWDTSTNAYRDNAVDLGTTSGRFDDIYATNGTIQTSDRNEKQDIEALSDAEQRVAVTCKGLLRKFRWKSSVADKGDEARIHFGIIAQDLQDAFTAEGLDAGRYGMFINSTWTDEETGEERSRMGVRYSELLAFIIAAI